MEMNRLIYVCLFVCLFVWDEMDERIIGDIFYHIFTDPGIPLLSYKEHLLLSRNLHVVMNTDISL